MAVSECTVEDLGHKLENAKIDARTKSFIKSEIAVGKDFCLSQEHPVHLSPSSESFPSNGSVSSSDTYGDSTNLYCSGNEYSEMAFVVAPNAFIPSPGPIYADVPVLNSNGYVSYAVDGVHYQSPVIDYSYLNQQVYSPFTSGMQYTPQGGDAYAYAPQVYQYPVQPYYQQGSIGQYVLTSSGLPDVSMMMVEAQDPPVIPSGYTSFNTYEGTIPSYPVAVVQPQPLIEAEAVPAPLTYPRVTATGGVMMIDAQDPSVVENSYTSGNAYPGIMPVYPVAIVQQQPLVETELVAAPVSYPSQTLRASAPSWVEPSKQKAAQKDGYSCKTEPVLQLNSAVCFPPLNKSSANGSVSKNSPISGFKAAVKGSSMPDSLTNESADAKVCDTEESVSTLTVQQVVLADPSRDVKDAWASKVKGPPSLPAANITFKSSDGSISKDPSPNMDLINSSDFVTEYDDAKFFIIKSYSDDNVYRSIQHNVWASTPNGNKKLDEAYHDAQQWGAGKHGGCPVFLFFSVNGSRQFCGVAEMTSPIDYNRTMEFWEQHKWSGSFQVKWHIVKDVPNSQFRRIILQNNENKPVTNSRDTQEVNLQQGLEMLHIFKSYPARGSILDEFPLLEAPLKADVRPQWSLQNFPKIGESVSKGQSSDSGLKITTKMNFAAGKTCSGSPKTDEIIPCMKVASRTSDTGQDCNNLEKDNKLLDKENIKIYGKEVVGRPA